MSYFQCTFQPTAHIAHDEQYAVQYAVQYAMAQIVPSTP